MPTITTEGEPPPRDYYAEALTRALDFGPARAAQLQALILALIERGVAADDIRSARLLAPLFDTPSIYPGPAASRGAGGDGTSDTVVDPSPPLPPPKPNPWWLTLAGRSALAVLGLVLLVLALIWLSQPSPVQPVVETPPTISTLAPSPEVTTTPTSAEQPQISEYLFSWPALAAIAALVLAASFWPALVRWWQRRKQRQLRRDPLPDRAPLAKIATRVARARLFTAAGMPEAIRRLRRYRAIPSQRLDVRRSLRATLAQGGAPSIRYARRRLSPDFVFLSERLQPHDHLPEFAEAWKDRLVEAGIGCEHFEFWGDPNTLLRVSDADGRRDDNAVRQPLDAVLARHDGGSVVVMLESFVALDATEDPQWLARSRQIATPFLMNPRDYPFWANEEARLADLGLPGFAATVPGTMALAERTDRAIDDPDGTPAPTPTPGQADLAAFLFSHRAMVLASDPPSAAQIATIVDTLERWLERGAFDWLRALAVLPMVNPGFTCFVGATLRDESLVTHERYLALSRLPWLRSAQMPDWLRLALLETLAPDALQRAAAVAAAYLAPPGPAVEREEQLVELRRAAEHPASRRKLAERLAAGATPGLTDKLLLEVLKGRPPDQLGVAFRGEIADEPHDWRRDPRVHAAVFAVFAGAAVLALQPNAWREAGGFSLFANRSDPNSKPSAGSTDNPTDAASTDAGAATITPVQPDSPVPPNVNKIQPPGLIKGNTATVSIQIASEAQRGTAETLRGTLDGKTFSGVTVSAPGIELRAGNSPNRTQVRCFDASGCAMVQALSGPLSNLAGQNPQYVLVPRKAPTKVPNLIEVWYGLDPADAAASNEGRWSALINAGNMDNINAFVQTGAVTWNTYFSSKVRQTPLQQVAERCNADGIRLFLAHGNDPDVTNIYGDSARFIAKSRCPPGSEANAILNPGWASSQTNQSAVPNDGPFIVYFDWDKSDITPETASVLDNVVSQFKRRSNARIYLAAYNDTTTSAAYSFGMSEREAASVSAYLISHGIPAGAISSQAFGKTHSRVRTANGVRDPMNRRVEITIVPTTAN